MKPQPICLLDTTTISDLFVRDTGTILQLMQSDPRSLAISSITDFEVRTGLNNPSKRLDGMRTLYDYLSQHWHVLPFDGTVVPVAASYRDYIKLSNQIIGPYQLLIGATAKAHGLTLVTSTPEEYQFLPDLTVVNWQEPKPARMPWLRTSEVPA